MKVRYRIGSRTMQADIGKYLLYFLITFPYLLPQYIEDSLDPSGIISISFTAISFIAMMACFLLNINSIVRGKVYAKTYLVLIVSGYVVYIYSTIINHGRLYPALSHSINVILLCVLVEIISQDNVASTAFLKVVRFILLFYAIINIIIITITPNGIPGYTTDILAPKFLFGNVNSTIRGIFPGICCSVILDKKENKKISIFTWVFFASILYLCFKIYFMGTAFICVTLLIAWNVLERPIRKHIWIIYLGVLISVLFVELFVVVQGSNNYIVSQITHMFGKTLDFSGRRAIWLRTILRIAEKPVWGHGYLLQDEMYLYVGNKYGSHNYYMDILFQRGIIGLIPTLILWISPLWLIKKRNIDGVTYTMIGLNCSLLIMFLSEPFYSSEFRFMPLLFVMLIRLFDNTSVNTTILTY